LPLVIERYHGCVCRLQRWAMKTQTKTNLELYLEYLKRYDLGHYVDQSLMFQPVVETVGDLLYTQREIWTKYSVEKVSRNKVMLRHVNEYSGITLANLVSLILII
jgi:hypothetical protein